MSQSVSDSDDELKTTIVIDNGGDSTRAGFAGASEPTVIFPTKVGHPRTNLKNVCDKQNYVGHEAVRKKGILSLKYPIEHGIVTNWDDMETLWHHTLFEDLKVEPEEHPVLLTEAPMNPMANREKMTQIMFETFKVPAMYSALQSVLCMFASGRKTGIVLDSGSGMTHVVPVYDNHHLPNDTHKSLICGRDLSDLMWKMLFENGTDFPSQTVYEDVKKIKETLCYVAYDYEQEERTVTDSTVQRTFERDHESLILVRHERYRCPEAMFKPMLMQQEMPGIHEILSRAISGCDESIQQELYRNIQLCGGSTLFPGFPERLRKEVEALAPPGTSVGVHPPPHGLLSPWVGGSMMAAQPSFTSMMVTSEEYDEHGPSIVHRKCY